LVSAALLMELSKYKDTVDDLANIKQVEGVLNMLFSSSNPVAKLVAANILNNLKKSKKSNEFAKFCPPNKLASLTDKVSSEACKAAINSLIPREPVAPNSALSLDSSSYLLGRAFTFGVIGSVWGRFRWWLHARRKGLSGFELKKLFIKKKVGRYVFALMGMDLFTQALMSLPKESPLFYYIPDTGVPLTTSLPIAEAALITFLSLWGIRIQRYIVFPIMLAAVQSNWYTIDRKTKPYQEMLGIDINKTPQFLYSQMKNGVETAADFAMKELVTTPEDNKKAK